MTTLWPQLPSVPAATEADRIAAGLALMTDPAGAPRDPAHVIADLGWTWRLRPMAPTQSPIRALLMPEADGRFHIVVDSRRSPSTEMVSWLLGHEIAHAMFYRPGNPPTRAFAATAREERFCDALADWFVAGLTGKLPKAG